MPRRNTRASAPLPLDPVIPNLADLLLSLLEGEPWFGEERDALAHALIVLPLVNQEARRLAAEVQHLGVCSSFEAARMGIGSSFRLFDGLHESVDPLSGVHSGSQTGFTSRHLSKAPLVQVKLEAEEAAGIISRQSAAEVAKLLGHHDCPGLQSAPKRVRVFVGRVRHVAQFVGAVHASVGACRVCGRETMLYDDESVGESNGSERAYWGCAGGLGRVDPSLLAVCSWECRDCLVEEVDRASGVSELELESYDAPPCTSGSRRIAMGGRAALRRNEVVSRRLRTTDKKPFRFLTATEVRRARRQSTTSLNVDIGLLLACEHAMALPRFRAKVLTPCVLGWRANRAVFTNATVRAASIYQKHCDKDEQAILSHLLHRPRWLDKMVGEAAAIFK